MINDTLTSETPLKTGDGSNNQYLHIVIAVLAVLVCVCAGFAICFGYMMLKGKKMKKNMQEAPHSPLQRVEDDENDDKDRVQQLGRKSVDESEIFNKIMNKQVIQNIEQQRRREIGMDDNKGVLLPTEETFTENENENLGLKFTPITTYKSGVGTMTMMSSEIDLKPPNDEHIHGRKGSYSLTDKIQKWTKGSFGSETNSNYLADDMAMQHQISYDEQGMEDSSDDSSDDSSTDDGTYTINMAPIHRKE